jgi:hypothetical protein
MIDALTIDDDTPDELDFEMGDCLRAESCRPSAPVVSWLATRLQTVATTLLSQRMRDCAAELDRLIQQKLDDQKGMVATFRKDTEQFVGAQQDELRRIQAAINSLIEQRQPNFYFARQPGEMPR